jgi:hypothetical protein
MAPPDIINNRNPTTYGLIADFFALHSEVLDDDDLRPDNPFDWY